MNEGHKNEGGHAAAQPQSSEASPPGETVSEKATAGETSEKKYQSQPGCAPANDSRKGSAPLDDARFAAGVVKLYEALLKEPIPEDMLRLVEQLGKQERK